MPTRTPLLLALTMGAVLLSVPPSAANHDLCPGNTHRLTGSVSGTVWDGNDDHWLLIVTAPAAIVTLDPGQGDVDLFILDPTCTVTVASSSNFGTANDAAAVPTGVYEVRVRFYEDLSDPVDGRVGYTLRVD